MAQVAIIITDLFEDSEYLEPASAFKSAGHQLIHVGLQVGVTVFGKKKTTPVVIDCAVTEVSTGDFDALLIPGGFSPDKLRADEQAVSFVKQFMAAGKPVFSICHGPHPHHCQGHCGAEDHGLGTNCPGYQICQRRLSRSGSSG